MQDEQTSESASDAGSAPAVLGVWLREARERAGTGLEATAAALHLDPAIVAALEAERFEALGAPVFVKGHLRALASHYGLDPAEAVQRYEATAGTAAVRPPDLIVQYQRPLRRNRALPLLAGLAVVLIVVALVVALLPRGAPAPDPTPAPATESAPPPSGAAVQPDSAGDDDDFAARLAAARARDGAAAPGAAPVDTPAAVPQSAIRAGADDTAVESQPPAADPPAPAPTATTGLAMRFSDTCWYEVRDAEGRRLATGTANAGDVRRVDGPRPLSVTVGVADAVSLTLDGEAVDIPPASRRGRSARLTLQ